MKVLISLEFLPWEDVLKKQVHIQKVREEGALCVALELSVCL